jgi:hypothetical protein
VRTQRFRVTDHLPGARTTLVIDRFAASCDAVTRALRRGDQEIYAAVWRKLSRVEGVDTFAPVRCFRVIALVRFDSYVPVIDRDDLRLDAEVLCRLA